MMKKLLALVMVLGVASLATAALQVSVDGTGYADGSTVLTTFPVTIGVYNTEATVVTPLVAWLEVTPGTEVAGTGTVTAGLPGTWSISDYGLYGGLYYWYIANDVPGVGEYPVGDLFNAQVQGETTVAIYDTNFGYISSINLVTPEPASMALLGLGGLFLSRRKK